MKIGFMSDSHSETYSKKENDAMKSRLARQVKEEKPDVIIHAGDLYGTIVDNALAEFAEPIREHSNAPIIFVPGNHEFWDSSMDKHVVEEANDEIDNNTFILQDESLVIDGIKFLGSTLWTDGNFGREVYPDELQFGDFVFVKSKRFNSDMFSFDDFKKEHARSRNWLGHELTHADDPCVVVTHHLPSMRSIDTKYKDHWLTPLFASNMDEFIMKHEPLLWIHGHTHAPVDYKIGKTRVVCNPRGYPDEGNEGLLKFIELLT